MGLFHFRPLRLEVQGKKDVDEQPYTTSCPQGPSQ